ncbi:hypothetical protein BDL97_10G063900 [Sphagnum fallax]|nr:hypothetical protein BDL97_10G063900 [Sphagnum fallax]KAH8950055.1 hypothetical protein BDL97_10G063900 [Sphagnum fallax]
MEKFTPDRKEEEQAVKRSKDEKKRQFVLLSKTPKRPPETVGAKSTPKTINGGGLASSVEKFTPNRKENLEPVKFKDEKGKVVLSKTLQAFSAGVTPKTTIGVVLASADKETQDRKEQDPLKSKDEKGKMLLSKTLKKPKVFSAKVTSNATNGGMSSSVGRVVRKVTVTTTKTITNTTTKTMKEEKREKRVFTLPGQRHEPPEERDALRIFYETLHEQIPGSEMAEVWMMEHGLLAFAEAKKVLERKQRRAQYQKNGTPSKSSSTPVRHSNGFIEKKAMTHNGKLKAAEPSPKGQRKRFQSDSNDGFIRPVKQLKT